MAESDSDQSTLLSFIGLLIGTFAYGALLTLGLLCFVQLNLGPRGTNSDWSCSSLQKRLFQVYIILLSIANTIFEVKNARTLGIILLQRPNPTPAGHLLVTPMDIVVAFVAILADGLLVWRCYMVQKALSGPRSILHWSNLNWIFPLCLLLTAVVSGASASLLSAGLPEGFSDRNPAYSQIRLLVTISLSANILLNLYVTCNIVTRLLLHRRMIVTSLGNQGLTQPHMKVVGMLLESAALNIPITVVAAVGVAVAGGGFGSLAMQLVVPCQSIASILIIYQVARGRALGEDNESRVPQSDIEARYSPRFDTLGESSETMDMLHSTTEQTVKRTSLHVPR